MNRPIVPKNSQQLSLFPLPQNSQTPQISSIPGVSAKEKRRYQVTIGDRVIASNLTSDEALAIAAECQPVGGVDE